MTDIPGGELIAHGPFEIASLKPQPQYLTIGSLVRISLDTGAIEYGDGYNPDDAARTFWDAMNKTYRDSLAAVERVRAVHRVSTLHDVVPGRAPYCENCRFTWPCPTIQALEQP